MQEIRDHLRSDRPPVPQHLLRRAQVRRQRHRRAGRPGAATFTTATASRSCTPIPAELSLGRRGLLRRRVGRPGLSRLHRDRPAGAAGRQGVDVEPMRVLFRQNRVISSIAAELDQKSCWEVLTDPQIASSISAPTSGRFSAATCCGRGSSRTAGRRCPTGSSAACSSTSRAERRDAGPQAEPQLRRRRGRDRAGRHRGRVGGGDRRGAGRPGALGRAAAGQHPGARVPGARPRRDVHSEPFYVVMGFAPTTVRRRHPRPRVAEAGGERRAARRALRGDGEPLAAAGRVHDRLRRPTPAPVSGS